MKNFILTALIISVVSINAWGQEEHYFVADGDTTFCTKIKLKLTQPDGYLKEFSYVDSKGETIELIGVENVPNVTTYFRGRMIVDRVPDKLSEPDGPPKWAERVVDGKLIVDLWEPAPDSRYGYPRFYIKMPDGNYYDIYDDEHRENHIVPFLKECEEFVNAYKGDYKENASYFEKMIELYNSLCE